ncbi:MAG: regulatory protein RecX [Candidatus Omnitrophica bacterium]|nr:regulatory protein RecX [Candidatus Omnitrophota bacterium]
MAELSPEENAWNTALRILEAGDKSRRELRDRLVQKRFKEEVVLKVLDRLEARGFLNDKTFAGRLAEKLGGRSASQRKMAFEMRRRGVPAEFIEEELARLAPDEDERLYQAGLKQWKKLNRLAPEVRTKRAFGSLARQGFDSEGIRRFFERVLREEKNKGDESHYDDHE